MGIIRNALKKIFDGQPSKKPEKYVVGFKVTNADGTPFFTHDPKYQLNVEIGTDRDSLPFTQTDRFKVLEEIKPEEHFGADLKFVTIGQ